jgi:hypothetical protein
VCEGTQMWNDSEVKWLKSKIRTFEGIWWKFHEKLQIIQEFLMKKIILKFCAPNF